MAKKISEGPNGSTGRMPLKEWRSGSSTRSSIVRVEDGSEVGAVIIVKRVDVGHAWSATATATPSTLSSQLASAGTEDMFITVSKRSSTVIPGGSDAQAPETNPGLSGNTALAPKEIGQPPIFLRNPGTYNHDLTGCDREGNSY